MKAKLESSSSYLSFKRLAPGAFNMGFIDSTLVWRIPIPGSRNPPESIRIQPNPEMPTQVQPAAPNHGGGDDGEWDLHPEVGLVAHFHRHGTRVVAPQVHFESKTRMQRRAIGIMSEFQMLNPRGVTKVARNMITDQHKPALSQACYGQ
jgi:hypothetical protein